MKITKPAISITIFSALLLVLLCIPALNTHAFSKSNSFGSKSSNTTKTLMVYMIGTNLESDSGHGSQDIDEMLAAKSSDRFNIVIQTGGTTKWSNPLIKGGTVQRFGVKNNQLIQLQDLGNISMVEPNTLTDFINYSVKNYPADEYILVLWDHGGSIPLSFGFDDYHTGSLTDIKIGQAIKNSGTHFDALIFNACEMCSLELFMSFEGYVDYVVAAESNLYGYGYYGSGIDYTSWINYAIDNKSSTQYYCEKILDDYRIFLLKNRIGGSMSVIRMDKIQEVYNCYGMYLKEATKSIKTKEGYEEFIKLRETLSSYEGTDAVDITTLATKFENKYSTPLINAITGAVIRTHSDIITGHGITAYCPYNKPGKYNEGRKSFVSLNYNTDIVKFYDTLVSKILYYGKNLSYADSSWYIAPEESSTDTSMPAKITPIEYTNLGNYSAIVLSDEIKKLVKSTRITMGQLLMIDNQAYIYMLGTDDWIRKDKDKNIMAVAPNKWMKINNMYPTIELENTSSYEDGSWSSMYLVYAYVNDHEAFLRLDTNSKNNNGAISGYYPCSFNSGVRGEFTTFSDGDMVHMAAALCKVSTNQMQYIKIGSRDIPASDLYSEHQQTQYGSKDSVVIRHTIQDVYGNIYQTPLTSIKTD